MMIIIFLFHTHNPYLYVYLHVAFIIRQAIIVKIFASFTFDGVFARREIYYYETTCFDYWRDEKHYKTLCDAGCPYPVSMLWHFSNRIAIFPNAILRMLWKMRFCCSSLRSFLRSNSILNMFRWHKVRRKNIFAITSASKPAERKASINHNESSRERKSSITLQEETLTGTLNTSHNRRMK